MTKTLVTGSCGFIGRHLIKKLPLDTICMPHDDIDRGVTWSVDQMFFLSTYGNMANHTDNFEMVRSNVYHVIWMLEKFRGYFLFMSSSSVMLPVQTPYSRTKRAAEEILQALPELKSCIVRPYSVTGVGEQKEHLIPTLIRSCMEGEEMLFDPSPVHDFIDVEDVVNGLIRLADEGATGIHEFGNGYGFTNQEVRELVETICGRKANVRGSPRLRPYDNTEWHAQSQTFHNSKPLMVSISEMVTQYRNEQNN